MATALPRLTPGAAIADPQGRASTAFGLLWNQLSGAVDGSLSSLQSQLTAIQAQQAQILAAQQDANNALTIADAGGGSPGAQSGSTAIGTLTISPAWAHGPLVNLAGVVANNLSVSLAFSGSQSLLSSTSDTGHYRIQEIVGLSETTVFTGDLMLYSTIGPGGLGWVLIPADLSASSWSTLSLARASVGAVSYRLDFILSTLTYNLDSAYLYVRRA